jgi:2-polyprenyl-3-methyl-5-hydroxy-6-metoxy-1,4-benzoquinol methylase
MDDELKEQQQLYDRGWRQVLAASNEQSGDLQANLQFVAATGLLKPGDKILEVGCGLGSVVFELTGQGYDVMGIDISHEAISYGLKKYGNIRLEVQPAEALPYENESFDVVLSFDLFEHIARIDEHIKEVWRVLRPQGHYLFQTPNKLSSAVAETMAHKSLKWRRVHPSLHTPSRLRRRLTGHQFSVEFTKINPVSEFARDKLQRLGMLGRIVEHVDFRRLPLWLQTNLYVIAHKLSAPAG